jgi:AAA15 family ATPase/GTPase
MTKKQEILNLLRMFDPTIKDMQFSPDQNSNFFSIDHISNNFVIRKDGVDGWVSMSHYTSSGTKDGFNILIVAIILMLKQQNSILFIDEYASTIHPNLASDILVELMELAPNVKFVLATHVSSLIDFEYGSKSKDRVHFIENRLGHGTKIERLSEQPASIARIDRKIENKYLAGIFGGTPE